MSELRVALAAALHESERRDHPGAAGFVAVPWKYLTEGERAWEIARAAAMLADTAFRTALAAGIARATVDLDLGAYSAVLSQDVEEAEALVARLLDGPS